MTGYSNEVFMYVILTETQHLFGNGEETEVKSKGFGVGEM